MSEQGQFKNYSTRRFRADLHYRMRLLAAQWGVTVEEAFNRIVEAGCDVFEEEARKVQGENEERRAV